MGLEGTPQGLGSSSRGVREGAIQGQVKHPGQGEDREWMTMQFCTLCDFSQGARRSLGLGAEQVDLTLSQGWADVMRSQECRGIKGVVQVVGYGARMRRKTV